jgi:hypothetical protein
MLSSVAQQAKDLRRQLKAVFPLCKFRVRSSNYSMGSSIRVSWIDGPTVAEVDAIASGYESIRRDEGSGEILSGGNRYVHCERRFSIAVFEAAVMTVCRDWGVEPVPTVVCGPSEFSSPHIPHEANPQRVGGGVKDLQWLVMDYLAERSFYPVQEVDDEGDRDRGGSALEGNSDRGGAGAGEAEVSVLKPGSPWNASAPHATAADLQAVEVVENHAKNGFELFFPGKPDPATRQLLRACGFRPSKKKSSQRSGQWFWYAKRTEGTTEFVAGITG